MEQAKHTPGPWNWVIHDHSMASLGVLPDPGLGNPLVLAVGPCPACAGRAEPREWKWGRCHTPNEADAHLIAAAPEILAALQNVQKLVSEAAMTGFNCHDGDWAERLFTSQQMTSAAIKSALTPVDRNAGGET